MKYIITESQYQYLRRLSVIDDLINSSLEMFDDWDRPKVNVDYMIRFLTTDVAELYFFRFDDDIYVDGEDYDNLTDFLESYLEKNWRDKIENIIKRHKEK